jgi:hypothetical protein
MKEEQSLLPCPKCGKDCEEPYFDDCGDWLISCECGIQFQCFGSKEETIKDWNTRTPIAQQSLSGSQSSPKCSHDMMYPTDGGKPTCRYCGHQGV